MRLSILTALVAFAAAVSGQPTLPNLPGGPVNSAATSLQNLQALQSLMAANPQAQLGAAQMGQFGSPQIPLNIPYGAGVQQPLMQQPLGAYGGVQQPLMQQPWTQQLQQPLGSFGTSPIAPITPGLMATAGTTPAIGNIGMAGLTGIGGTIPAVLPQNFGNPPAQFGQLQQPVLSAAQAQNLIPLQQLQQQLEARVAAMGGQAQLTGAAFNNIAQQGMAPLPINPMRV